MRSLRSTRGKECQALTSIRISFFSVPVDTDMEAASMPRVDAFSNRWISTDALASKWAAVKPANPEPMTATFTAELGWVIWKERKEQSKAKSKILLLGWWAGYESSMWRVRDQTYVRVIILPLIYFLWKSSHCLSIVFIIVNRCWWGRYWVLKSKLTNIDQPSNKDTQSQDHQTFHQFIFFRVILIV